MAEVIKGQKGDAHKQEKIGRPKDRVDRFHVRIRLVEMRHDAINWSPQTEVPGGPSKPASIIVTVDETIRRYGPPLARAGTI